MIRGLSCAALLGVSLAIRAEDLPDNAVWIDVRTPASWWQGRPPWYSVHREVDTGGLHAAHTVGHQNAQQESQGQFAPVVAVKLHLG